LLPKAAEAIATLRPLFAGEWRESGRTYLPGGVAPGPLAPLRNPALAETYRRILREAKAASAEREGQIEAARAAFYEGFVAEAIDSFVRHTEVLDATGRHRGLLTGADLAAWRATVEPAVSGEFHGSTVYKPGPWSQGPVFLQQLALLEGFDLARMGLGSVAYLHTLTECAKLAYADREAWYGDPEFTDVPLRGLLDRRYAEHRRRLVTEHASAETRPGRPEGRTPRLAAEQPVTTTPLPAWLAQLDSGLPTILPLTEAKGDTCCVAVADRHGNLVVATPSGGWLKSSPVVPGLGFPLGTRGQMTELDAGYPNSLAPGKRPRTTLSPTVVLRDGQPWLAFGTPGGDQQDQWTMGFFLAVERFGLDLQTAAEVPAHHTDHVRSSFTPRRSRSRALSVDERCGPGVLAGLRERGHDVTAAPAFSLGTVCAVGVDQRDGQLLGAAGPRGLQGYAAGR
jgi:gamma-glutamyltranspeptidase/glutathione hydrolase